MIKHPELHSYIGGEILQGIPKDYCNKNDLIIIENSAASYDKNKVRMVKMPFLFNPLSVDGYAIYFDDFLGSNLNVRWTPTSYGTGSSVAMQDAQGGQVLLRAGNGASRGAELYFRFENWSSLEFEPIWKIRAKTTGTVNREWWIELNYTDSNNYCHLSYDSTIGPNWLLRTSSSGSLTSTNTGIPLDTNWHVYEIRGSTTAVTAYIDGVLVATNTTNIHTLLGHVSIFIGSFGTGGTKDVFVDCAQYSCVRQT